MAVSMLFSHSVFCPHPARKNTGSIAWYGVIIAVGMVLGVILAIYRARKQGLKDDLYQNGELLQTIRLDTVTTEYTFEVSGNAGATNTVCVRPGSIAIVSASCPDQICVHQGFISTSLLPITCLPNRLVIRVREEVSVPDDTAPVPDGVTY